jgi:hypothetical protein
VIDPSTGLTKRQSNTTTEWPTACCRYCKADLFRSTVRSRASRMNNFSAQRYGLTIPNFETIHRTSGKPAILINSPRPV